MMKAYIAKAVVKQPGLRSLYTAALSVSSPATQFFDPAYVPPPRLNPAPHPTAQQSKSQSSTQPATYLGLSTNPIPITSSAPGSSRTPPNSPGAIPPIFFSTQGPVAPSFLPNILQATERVHTRPIYRLDSGAYGIPKSRSKKAPNMMLASTPLEPCLSTQPSPETLDLSTQVGDDSYFMRSNALGVADGVGGWSQKPNGNSALFSRRLMHYCSHEISLLYPPSPPVPPSFPPYLTPAAVLAPLPSSLVDPNPVDILQRAYEQTLELCKADGTLGSSTALLALLLTPQHSYAQPQLRIAHVGDCLICLIRKNELVYRSSEQQHKFNYPFQLGPQSTTTPIKDAMRIDLAVQEGDIIVAASDGMGDNLWDEDVLEEVVKWGSDVKGLSEALAKRALGVSEGGAFVGETPFGRRAHEEKRNHVGGKADDISVLVAVIEGCDAVGLSMNSRSAIASR